MPLDAAPLFRPDVVRRLVAGFSLPDSAHLLRERFRDWTTLFSTSHGTSYKESELVADFFTHVFIDGLGYTPPLAQTRDGRHTFSREKLVEADGKFADAVLGTFSENYARYVVAVEGKGPLDSLERPFAGRRVSAVDQGYRYAINLPCDWIIVTNLRELRLYHKGSTQRTYERFVVSDMARDEHELARLVYLLGAQRVVPADGGPSHLYELLTASQAAGEAVTRKFYEEYAGIRRSVLRALLDDNPRVRWESVLEATQKLLDRVLFVAFAEDRNLLPQHSLKRAYRHSDPYNPRPTWDNFRGLFRAIDQGSPTLGIARYNGGLFAYDPVLDDALVVSDAVCSRFARFGEYDYRPPTEADIASSDDDSGLVDVEILGHILEQSITDLELLRAEISERTSPDGDGSGLETVAEPSRRHREGAYYTQAFVTRYLVTEALRPVLEERFDRLRAMQADQATGTAPRVLIDPKAYVLEDLNAPQRQALVSFWESWLAELQRIRILDPAVGSGAFLIEAFDQLQGEYERAIDHLEDLRGSRSLFDPDRTILERNLFGVDLNVEAVDICRLSIWIKTAQRGKILTDLDRNILVGNSVVADATLDPRALDWATAFPEVVADGGFDVVVGNPPYVRAELLTTIKPHLAKRFDTFHGSADLYVYFYELGLRVLRPGGRLAFIVSNKWLKTGYAEPLRRFFAERTWVEEIVDLGHARQVFPDADVFPSLLIIRKPDGSNPPETVRACVIPREVLRTEQLAAQIIDGAYPLSRNTLGAGPWTLDPPGLTRLIEKLRSTGVPLPEYLGVESLYGIKTGLNDAFLIDGATRDALIKEDRASAEIIRPCLRGQEIDRWHPAWGGEWMIFARRGIEIDRFPAVKRHLERFRQRLEPKPAGWEPGNDYDRWPGRKPGKYPWYELQDPVDYWEAFERPKLVHTDIAWRPEFAFVEEAMYPLNTVYVWPTDDLYTLGVLNSPLLWWYAWRNAQHGKDEALRLFSTFTHTIPIARPSADVHEAVTSDVRTLLDLTRDRHSLRHTLFDWLRMEFGIDSLGQRLALPEDLDEDDFIAEVRKRRAGRRGVTATELRQLRMEFATTAKPLRALSSRMAECERRVSAAVMLAYALTPEEIALIWRTAPPRTPLVEPSEDSSGG